MMGSCHIRSTSSSFGTPKQRNKRSLGRLLKTSTKISGLGQETALLNPKQTPTFMTGVCVCGGGGGGGGGVLHSPWMPQITISLLLESPNKQSIIATLYSIIESKINQTRNWCSGLHLTHYLNNVLLGKCLNFSRMYLDCLGSFQSLLWPCSPRLWCCSRTWGLCVDVPRNHVVVNGRQIVPSPIAVKWWVKCSYIDSVYWNRNSGRQLNQNKGVQEKDTYQSVPKLRQ